MPAGLAALQRTVGAGRAKARSASSKGPRPARRSAQRPARNGRGREPATVRMSGLSAHRRGGEHEGGTSPAVIARQSRRELKAETRLPRDDGIFFLQVETNGCRMLGSSLRVADRCYGKFATCYAGNPRCYREFWDCYTIFEACYKFQAPKIASATSSAPTANLERRLSLCYRPDFKNAAKGRSLAGYAFCGHKTLLPAPAARDRPGWYGTGAVLPSARR